MLGPEHVREAASAQSRRRDFREGHLSPNEGLIAVSGEPRKRSPAEPKQPGAGEGQLAVH